MILPFTMINRGNYFFNYNFIITYSKTLVVKHSKENIVSIRSRTWVQAINNDVCMNIHNLLNVKNNETLRYIEKK